MRYCVRFQTAEAAEKNYPAHDKELLVIKHDLVELRVHLLGFKPFVIYTSRVFMRCDSVAPPPTKNGSVALIFRQIQFRGKI